MDRRGFIAAVPAFAAVAALWPAAEGRCALTVASDELLASTVETWRQIAEALGRELPTPAREAVLRIHLEGMRVDRSFRGPIVRPVPE